MNKEADQWEALTKVIVKVCSILGPLQAQVPLGGSCGLLLQGVPIGKQPQDIDMYYDGATGDLIYAKLLHLEKNAPRESETDRYRSILSHYTVDGYTLELVGDFNVEALGSRYVVEISAWPISLLPNVCINNQRIYLMPLAHELIFNILRERHDRVEAILPVIKAKPELHTASLKFLLKRNNFGETHQLRLRQELGQIIGEF